jgi:AraC-like DNA-binding protein
MINKYDFTLSDPDTFKVFSAKDLIFLYWICPQVDQHLKLFNHYNEIVFTLTGKKTMHHNGVAYPVTDEQSLFIKKTAYTTEKHEMVGWETLAFFFQDAFLRQVFNEYREHLPLKNLPPPPKEMFIPINVNETMRAFCYSIVPYFKAKVPPSESLLELKFKEIIYVILSNPENAGLLSFVNSIVDQQKTPIWEVMEANYMFNLTIDEYARIAGRSTAAFKREFNEHYGTSPGKWLINRRLEHTKLLLSTSTKNVSEIAFDCGFENLSHFSRVYKDKYGQSPLQYRNNNPVILAAQ